MEEDHMRKVFIDDCCKTLIQVSMDVAFLLYSTVDSALQHFSLSGFWNIPCLKPYSCVKHFCLWLFCNKPQWWPYACGLLPCRMLALLWTQASAQFSELQKNRFWARLYMISLQARVRKPFRKNAKKLIRALLLSKEHLDRNKNMWMCVKHKIWDLRKNSHRKWHHERDPERPAPTVQPQLCFVEKKKRTFFWKKKNLAL